MSSSTLFARCCAACALLGKVASYLQSPLLLIVRLYWGWSFFQTGTGKLGNLSKPTAFFTELGIPFPAFNAVLVGTTETVGGLLLLVGCASRLAAIPLTITLVVAYLTTESEALHAIFSDPDKFVSATPFQFMFAALLVLIFGPGAISIDRWIGCEKPRASEAGRPPN